MAATVSRPLAWKVAGLGIGCAANFLIGSLYVFAVYQDAVKDTFNYTQKEVELMSSMLNMGLGVGFLPGMFYDRFGPQWTSAVGLVVSVTAYMLIWSTTKSVPFYSDKSWLMAIYFFVCGLGSIFTYMVTLNTNVINFDKKHTGKVIGLLTSFFSGSPSVFAVLYYHVYSHGDTTNPENQDYPAFMLTFAISFAVIDILCIAFLRTYKDVSNPYEKFNNDNEADHVWKSSSGLHADVKQNRTSIQVDLYYPGDIQRVDNLDTGEDNKDDGLPGEDTQEIDVKQNGTSIHKDMHYLGNVQRDGNAAADTGNKSDGSLGEDTPEVDFKQNGTSLQVDKKYPDGVSRAGNDVARTGNNSDGSLGEYTPEVDAKQKRTIVYPNMHYPGDIEIAGNVVADRGNKSNNSLIEDTPEVDAKQKRHPHMHHPGDVERDGSELAETGNKSDGSLSEDIPQAPLPLWNLLINIDYQIFIWTFALASTVGLVFVNNITVVSDSLYLTAYNDRLMIIVPITNAIVGISVGIFSDAFKKRIPRMWFFFGACCCFVISQIIEVIFAASIALLMTATVFAGIAIGTLWAMAPTIMKERFYVGNLGRNWGIAIFVSSLLSLGVEELFGYMYDSHVTDTSDNFCYGMDCVRGGIAICVGIAGLSVVGAFAYQLKRSCSRSCTRPV